MMGYVEGRNDELAEIDLTEDEIDSMMAAGEQVEVVGPPAAVRQLRFEVYREGSRRFGWRLSSGTGEVLATSGKVYPTKQAALRADGIANRRGSNCLQRRSERTGSLDCSRHAK